MAIHLPQLMAQVQTEIALQERHAQTLETRLRSAMLPAQALLEQQMTMLAQMILEAAAVLCSSDRHSTMDQAQAPHLEAISAQIFGALAAQEGDSCLSIRMACLLTSLKRRLSRTSIRILQMQTR
jgi:hypothetical protein